MSSDAYEPLSDQQKAAIRRIAPDLADEIVQEAFVDDLRAAAQTLRGGLNVGSKSMAGGDAQADIRRANRLDYMADKIEASK